MFVNHRKKKKQPTCMKAQSKNYILLICLYIPNIGYKSSLLQAGSYIFMIILTINCCTN